MKRLRLLWFVLGTLVLPAFHQDGLCQQIDAATLTALPNAYGQIIDPKDGAANGLIIVFTNHQCRYANLYIARLNALHAELIQKGIKVVAIESDIDSFEGTINSLNDFLAKTKVQYTYLVDLDNKIAKALAAESSPHAYLLQPTESGYKIVYDGSIDNNSRKPESATRNYLKDAIAQMLNGDQIRFAKTKAIGCDLKSF